MAKKVIPIDIREREKETALVKAISGSLVAMGLLNYLIRRFEPIHIYYLVFNNPWNCVELHIENNEGWTVMIMKVFKGKYTIKELVTEVENALSIIFEGQEYTSNRIPHRQFMKNVKGVKDSLDDINLDKFKQ